MPIHCLSRWIPALALGLCLAACSRGTPQDATPPNPKGTAPLAGDDVVLAYVGESRSPVTAYDARALAEHGLGRLADVAINGKASAELAESAITSRALAQLREAELDAKARAELDKRVAAFRERLLVKGYLKDHADVPAIPESEMRTYYERHLEKFGQREQRGYELAYVKYGKDVAVRSEFLRELTQIVTGKDWRAAVTAAQSRGVPVGYRQGQSELNNLPKKLRKAAAQLAPGEFSSLISTGERAYVVRVTRVETAAARPFEEVRDRIAKILKPRATKRAIEAVKREALDNVDIERVRREGKVAP